MNEGGLINPKQAPIENKPTPRISQMAHQESPSGEKIIVQVEDLIPGIDITTEPIKYAEGVEGRNTSPVVTADTAYIDELSPKLSQNVFLSQYEVAKNDPEKLNALIKDNPENYALMCFQNQIVVDLGCGDTHGGYCLAAEGGAKGYVGVDIACHTGIDCFDQERNDGKTVREMGRIGWNNVIPDEDNPDHIPASFVFEDMLRFLKRLPDDSVSIILSGIELFSGGCADTQKKYDQYRQDLAKEISRVIHPDGVAAVAGVIDVIPHNLTLKTKIYGGHNLLVMRKEKKND